MDIIVRNHEEGSENSMWFGRYKKQNQPLDEGPWRPGLRVQKGNQERCQKAQRGDERVRESQCKGGAKRAPPGMQKETQGLGKRMVGNAAGQMRVSYA